MKPEDIVGYEEWKKHHEDGDGWGELTEDPPVSEYSYAEARDFLGPDYTLGELEDDVAAAIAESDGDEDGDGDDDGDDGGED